MDNQRGSENPELKTEGMSDDVDQTEDYDHNNDMGEILEEEVIDDGVEMLNEHDEIIHADDLLHSGDMLEYIEDDGTVGAEEIVMDEELMVEEDELATQSLVALSRSLENKEKNVRQFIRDNAPPISKSPRILRRPVGRQSYENQPRQHHQQSSMGINRQNYPVPVQTKRLLPVATVQAGSSKGQNSMDRSRDWREDQKRMLEIYEIYDCLPEHMREPFKRVLETSRGNESLPSRIITAKRIALSHNRLIDPRDPYSNERLMMEESMNSAPLYKERPMMNDGQGAGGSHAEMERMVAHQNHDNEMKEPKNNIENELLADMPQLEEAPHRPHPLEATIDVETYDSGDDADIRAGVEYVMEAEETDYRGSRKRSTYAHHMRHGEVILPEMREDYYGSMDLNSYSANAIMNANQIQENRFCTGCKMSLKRSIYYHHSRMIKKFGICNIFTPKRFPCGYAVSGNCDARLGTLEKLCEHMWQIHGAPTLVKSELFNNEAEFEVFLRELEGKGGNFRMSRGNKMIKAGLVQYFRCNRMQSVSKDRTLRACDELSIYGSGDRRLPEVDPFTSQGGKPCLRTEEACTAFFRKAYLPNGSIEVRYCDHHLHDDERVRLPPAVKERIFEMYDKKLPAPVIMMVLQSADERDRFCQPGSAVERRILALTPKDIANALMSKPGRMRKRLSLENRRSGVDVVNIDPIPSTSGGEHRDDDDDDTLEEDAAEGEERSLSRAAAGAEAHLRQQEPEAEIVDHLNGPVDRTMLSELEQKMLEAYEANQDHILTDLQKMKRLENKKRHQREAIRTRVYALGRFIKTMNFADLSMDQLDEMYISLKTVLDLTEVKGDQPNMHFGGGNMLSIKKEMPEMEHESMESIDVENISSACATPSRRGRKRRVMVEEHHRDSDIVQETEDRDEVPSESAMADTSMDVLSEARSEETMERIVVDEAPHVASAPKRGRQSSRGRGRPRGSVMRKEIKKEVEDEDLDDVALDIPPPIVTPSRTRTGRVVRPRTIVDV